MGGLVDDILNLRVATAALSSLCDPTQVLSSGYSLCETVVSEYSLCGRATRELPALGEMLVRGKRTYSEAMGFIQKGSKANLESVKGFRRKVEERHPQTIIAHLERFLKFLTEVDDRLGALEKCCRGVEQRASQLGETCWKHRGLKSAAGGFLLVSGCFALVMAVAAVATRRTDVAASKASEGMAALMGRVQPMNTGLSGGLAAVLGARASSNAAAHARLSTSFRKLSERMREQTAAVRTLATRFQRLVKATESVLVLFRVQGVVGSLDQAVWVELLEWVDVSNAFFLQLVKETTPLVT
ncbi:hypothetical protein BSKO_10457 [Bryopsis sp. KO-2023]|nr:hypothetical protein BSKO_10457 [Bryopsis sp. KO-2023]